MRDGVRPSRLGAECPLAVTERRTIGKFHHLISQETKDRETPGKHGLYKGVVTEGKTGNLHLLSVWTKDIMEKILGLNGKNLIYCNIMNKL